MKNDLKIGSNKSFGIVFFFVFLIIGLFFLEIGSSFSYISIFLAMTFLLLGVINSKFLTPLNKIWFKFGIFLGYFISPIVMALIFFFVVTPTSLLLKIFKKDVLNLKKNSNKSYWIIKSKNNSNMNNQY